MFKRLAHWLTPLIIFLAVGAVGQHVAEYKISLIKDIQYTGHSDESAYAMMGRSLAEHGNLNTPWVSYFFISYNRGITHREDHWPPFLSFCMVPFLWWYGDYSWVYKLAPIYIGSIGLPLAAAFLGYVYSRRGYVGLIAGFLMMANMTMFEESLKTLSDISTAMLVTAFAAAILATRTRPRFHIIAGLLAGLAYYAKGSELALLAIYPFAAALAAGRPVITRRWWLAVLAVGLLLVGLFMFSPLPPVLCEAIALALLWVAITLPSQLKALASVWPFAGMTVACLLILPWFAANFRDYGNPVHSTQNYVSGYIGLVEWEMSTYGVYWNQNLPQTRDRWERDDDRWGDPHHPVYSEYVRNNTEEFTRYALFGPSATIYEWEKGGPRLVEMRNTLLGHDVPAEAHHGKIPVSPDAMDWKEPQAARMGLLMLAALPVLLLGSVPLAALLQVLDRRRGMRRAEQQAAEANKTGEPPPPAMPPVPRYFLFGPTLALILIALSQWMFIVYLWQVIFRFSFVFLPVVAVIGIGALARLIEFPLSVFVPRWLDRWQWIPTLLLAVVLVGAAHFCWDDLVQYHHTQSKGYWDARRQTWAAYPYHDELGYVNIGKFLKDRLPDAILMARNPWEIMMHAGPENKGVAMPDANPEIIFAVARYYHASLYLDDIARPGMAPYLSGQLPGLVPLSGAPGRIYQFDFSRLPGEAEYQRLLAAASLPPTHQPRPW